MIDSPIDCPLAGAEGARLPDSSFGNQNEVPRPLLGLGGRRLTDQRPIDRRSGVGRLWRPTPCPFFNISIPKFAHWVGLFLQLGLKEYEGGPPRIALFFFYISPVGWGEY
uniref:Uncharacterized protein n=1 Tax=Placozoa sp. H17 HM-2017 TaxID=2017600 RepID=A0A7I6N5R7_9METZ|nr:hypothetical protein [Placozoa sp. H17 HM-2017]